MRSYRTLVAALVLLAPPSPGWGLQLSDLWTDCRIELRDTATDATFQRFTNAQLTSFINDGQSQINNDVDLLSNTVAFDLAAGKAEYALPADFKNITRVTLQGKRIPATDYNALDANSTNWTITTATPTLYYINSYSSAAITLNIGFYPAPKTATTNNSVVVFYAQIPAVLANATDTPFSSRSNFAPYHFALSHYCALRGWDVQNRPDLAKSYADLFAHDLASMKEALNVNPDYNPSATGFRGPPSQNQ